MFDITKSVTVLQPLSRLRLSRSAARRKNRFTPPSVLDLAPPVDTCSANTHRHLTDQTHPHRRLGNAPCGPAARRRPLATSHYRDFGSVTDIGGYPAAFLRLFGFGLPGVDYEAEADPIAPMPSAA
jgi:hypothetical protein